MENTNVLTHTSAAMSGGNASKAPSAAKARTIPSAKKYTTKAKMPMRYSPSTPKPNSLPHFLPWMSGLSEYACISCNFVKTQNAFMAARLTFPAIRENFLQRLVALHRFDIAAGHELARADDAHAVAQLFRHIQHVRGKEHRRAARAEFLHQLFHGVHGGGIQPHKRLIEHQQARLVHKGGDERQALLHAVRIRTDQIAQRARHFEQLRIAANLALARGRVHAENVRHEIEVLNAGEIIV